MTVPSSLRVNDRIEIPRSELQFAFVRSSGPGGQNVNKVASKAVLHWNAVQSPALPEDVRQRLVASERRRINDRGELVLTSQRYRDQPKNIDDCLAKLTALILAAAKRPKVRRRTKPSRSSREARLNEKRVTSDKKRRRRFTSEDH
jgi:ribosome-associated protein